MRQVASFRIECALAGCGRAQVGTIPGGQLPLQSGCEFERGGDQRSPSRASRPSVQTWRHFLVTTASHRPAQLRERLRRALHRDSQLRRSRSFSPFTCHPSTRQDEVVVGQGRFEDINLPEAREIFPTEEEFRQTQHDAIMQEDFRPMSRAEADAW